MKFRVPLIAFILLIFSLLVVHAQAPVEPALSLSGGGNPADQVAASGNPASLAGFVQAARQQARRLGQSSVNLLIVPTPLTTNPFSISPGGRETLLALAEQQRSALELACAEAVGSPDLPCTATILPVYIRTDASSAANLAYIDTELSAIYFLDGQPDMAMRIFANTPLERAISDAYQRGVLVGGTGAGMDLLSAQMLAGYQAGFSAENALAFGAIDLRALPGSRGILSSLDYAIFQSELFTAGRLGLLLNALSDPNSVNVGLGVDRNTSVEILGSSQLTRVVGEQTALIVDAQTYHAADAARYRGTLNYLSLRNVLVHALTQGETSFNFKTLAFSQIRPPTSLERRFETLSLPANAGSLYLLSTFQDTWSTSTLLNQFVNEAGGQQARILHVLAGYATADAAQQEIETFNQTLGLETYPVLVTAETLPDFEPELDSYDAIIFSLAERQVLPVLKDRLGFLRVAWFAGKPLLATNEAVVVLGASYLNTPNRDQSTSDTQDLAPFDPSRHTTRGLSLLPINLEVELTGSNRWGGMFSLAYNNPGLVTLGLANHTAVVIQRQQTLVQGENIVASLDLRNATLGEAGSGVRFINGMLDVFAPGDLLAPSNADSNGVPVPAATPEILYPSATPTTTPTTTATLAPTNTPRARPPTRTPRPSPTTPASPPSRDPTTSNLMVFFSILLVIVILFGVLINRPQIKLPKQ